MPKASILIVEDDAIIAEDIAIKLADLGYKINGVIRRGEEAVTLALNHRPDLILMDIRLEGALDGVEAARQIRRECDIPIIYLTAYCDHETLERASLTEPAGYILKPFERHFLETYIEMAIHKHQTQRKLRESEQRYRLFFDRNPDAVYSLDQNGRFSEVNPACEMLTGYTLAELKQKNFAELCAPDQVAMATAQFQKALYGLVYTHFETAIIRKDGRRAEVWVAGEAITVEGKPIAVHCTTKDITEHKQAEEDRIILSKLESTGILAGGIAHDYNNLLAAAILNLGMTRSDIDCGRDPEGSLEALRQNILAATKLTKQLITFADGGAPVRKPVCLAEQIQSSVRLSLSGANVRGDVAIDAHLLWTPADASQIGQVIHNLCLNARDAMPQGGTIHVRAENVTLPLESGPALPAGDYVHITVADQGFGIPREVLPRIFDPYFSTKERGSEKGMGLGLTICHTIIKKHEGAITTRSNPGAGTTFHIYLPTCEEVKVAESKKAESASSPRSQTVKKIIVMDDEDCMRFAVAAALKAEGYHVATASKGEEAIELYAEAQDLGAPFDAVILDLTVRGGMGGKDTLEALIKIDPNVKALVMSGYSEDPVLMNPERYGFKAGMEKSFSVAQLTEMMSRIL